MREDYKMREISKFILLILVKCIIPNQEQFNDIEDKFINKNLSNLCFKDSAHIKLQQENQEQIEKENGFNMQVSTPEVPTTYTTFNSMPTPSPQERNEHFLGKTKTRKRGKDQQESARSEPVGVRLVCDSPNEDLKKYFTKTVFFFLI